MATAVTPTVKWATSLDEALARAQREGRLVMLDFFSPT